MSADGDFGTLLLAAMCDAATEGACSCSDGTECGWTAGGSHCASCGDPETSHDRGPP